MNEDPIKELLAPYQREPRMGFSGRVMARLDARPEATKKLSWWGVSADLLGTAAAMWLFLAALNLPEPVWYTQDQVLSSGIQMASVSQDAVAVPEWMVGDEQ